MPTEPTSLTLSNVGYAFDHPEAVAWGPDGRAYAGGEAGQLYRFSLDGKTHRGGRPRARAASCSGSRTTPTPTPMPATTARPACTASRLQATVTTYCQRQRRAEDARAELSGVRRPRQSLRLGFRRMGASGRLHLEDRAGRRGRNLGPAGKRLHQRHVPLGRRQVALRRRIQPAADFARRDQGGRQRRRARGRRRTAAAGARRRRLRRRGRSLHQPLQSQHHLPAHRRRASWSRSTTTGSS